MFFITDASIRDKEHGYSTYVWISLTGFHFHTAAPPLFHLQSAAGTNIVQAP